MPQLTENEFRRVSHRCEMAMEDIKWTNTADFTGDLTLNRAVEFAKNGQDAGYENTLSIQPKTACHHEWMEFARLLTLLFNRNREFKKFTILRNGLLK